MDLLILTSIPLLVLVVAGRRLSPEIRKLLILTSIPFGLILAFYSILVIIGLVLILVTWQYIIKKSANKQTSERTVYEHQDGKDKWTYTTSYKRIDRKE